jgi:hypothetical protein
LEFRRFQLAKRDHRRALRSVPYPPLTFRRQGAIKVEDQMQNHTQTFDRLAAALDRANSHYVEVENSENDSEFDHAADAQLEAEDELIDCRAESFDQLVRQVAILKRRASGGFDVAPDLARLSLGPLSP